MIDILFDFGARIISFLPVLLAAVLAILTAMLFILQLADYTPKKRRFILLFSALCIAGMAAFAVSVNKERAAQQLINDAF